MLIGIGNGIGLRREGSLLSAWDPSHASGYYADWDAEQEAARRELGTEDTAALDTLTDGAGGGFNATQATSGRRPTLLHDGTRWVVRGDGSDDLLVVPVTAMPSTRTEYVVAIPSSVAAGLALLVSAQASGGTAARFYLGRTTAALYSRAGGATDSGNITSATSVTSGTPHIHVATVDGSTLRAAKNDGAFASASYSNAALGTAGMLGYWDGTTPSSHWAGDLIRRLVYDEVHDADTIAQVLTYLDTHYSLGLGL